MFSLFGPLCIVKHRHDGAHGLVSVAARCIKSDKPTAIKGDQITATESSYGRALWVVCLGGPTERSHTFDSSLLYSNLDVTFPFIF